jgi:DNA-binding NtrC family response regulator
VSSIQKSAIDVPIESKELPKINADILVIDDEPLVSALINRYLDGIKKNSAYSFSSIQNFESGWELLSSDLSQVKVAIVDILLPQITGVDLVKNLISRYPKIGIVTVSGMATEPMKRSLRLSLPEGPELLAKPLRKEAFLEAFDMAWNRQHRMAPVATETPTATEEPLWSTPQVTDPGLKPLTLRRVSRKKLAV